MPRSPGLKFVGVREFKEGLTGYLGKKHELVVTRHGKPIARIVPVEKGSPQDLLLEIGTQAHFKKSKPPTTYRFDSSLSPALD